MTVVRRDRGTKRPVPLAGATSEALADLDATQASLLAEAAESTRARTHRVDGLAEAAEAAASGFAVLPWAQVGEDGEAKLAASGVTVRCLQRPDGSLAERDDEADLLAVVAKAY